MTPRTHEWAVRRLKPFAIGLLPEEDTLEVEEHVRGCDECRARLPSITPAQGREAAHLPASLIATWARTARAGGSSRSPIPAPPARARSTARAASASTATAATPRAAAPATPARSPPAPGATVPARSSPAPPAMTATPAPRPTPATGAADALAVSR